MSWVGSWIEFCQLIPYFFLSACTNILEFGICDLEFGIGKNTMEIKRESVVPSLHLTKRA